MPIDDDDDFDVTMPIGAEKAGDTDHEDDEDTGPRVRILDLSGGAEDNIVEVIKGFQGIAHANAFARAYVRDSVEICRQPGASPRDTLTAWFAFGENVEIIDGGDDAWKSATELDDFVSNPSSPMERDWRALDPRRLIDAEPEAMDFDDDDDLGSADGE